jgi:hypothetical protein
LFCFRHVKIDISTKPNNVMLVVYQRSFLMNYTLR